jgi:hypothetical protein
MGNICNIFSNDNFEQKHLKNLNIFTPQFIPEEIPIQNNYSDLSNSHAIPIPIANANAFPSNYLDNSPVYVNTFSSYSSSNYSLPNSYQIAEPTIIHHYYYNYNDNDNTNTNTNTNTNDNTNNLLLTEVLLSELEFVDDLYCD